MTSSAIAAVKQETEAQPGELASLGSRLKSLRTARGMTVEAAAQRARISKSALSKIENEKMSPTYEILIKIVTGYGLEMSDIFSRVAGMDGISVTRADDEKLIKTEHIYYKLHASDFKGKAFSPLHCNISTCKNDDDLEWNQHPGQEFIYVISGAVELQTKPDNSVVIRAGESVYLDSTIPHAVRSLIEPSSEVVWIAARR